MTDRARRLLIGGVVFFVLWILLRIWTALLPDIWWFEALSSASGKEYIRVFWTILGTKIIVGVVMTLLLLGVSVLNISLLHRLAPPAIHHSVRGVVPVEIGESDIRRFAKQLLYGAAIAFSLALGYAATAQWEVFQRWFHASGIAFHSETGEVLTDPLFGKSVAFYILQLPFLQFLSGWFLAISLPLAILMTVMYFLYGGIYNAQNRLDVRRGVRVHLGTLYGLAFLALAWVHRLGLYELLYRENNKFFGAGYVEVHADRPILWILVGISVLTAIAFFVGIVMNRLKPAVFLAMAYLIGIVIGRGFYPGIISQFKVAPNEQKLQREYIANNIEATRHAFGLDRIEVREYDATASELTLDVVQAPEVKDNVRLWDPRPLLEVYQQAQELRPQYDFADVDIDRYDVAGMTRQVTLAAREVDTRQLTRGARSWVNRTFNFTHGYGLVVGPVNEVREGKPHYYVKDIPLSYEKDWVARLDEEPGPRIYYGERTTTYAIVNPGNPTPVEFDYPFEGAEFARYTYNGKGGVRIDSLIRRLTYMAKFSEYNILLSSDIRPGARILYNRTVLDRVERIAPFLKYDPDPYLVIADGRLYWMIDAYMTTYRYPYSRPLEDAYRTFITQTRGRGASTRVLPRGIPWGNYIRNSVKVVVDVYDGSVAFYRLDQSKEIDMEDPLLESYARIFPTLFRPFSEMSDALKRHIRYPRTLFWLQATQLTRYHMTDPDTFYLEEDLWDLTYEIYEEQPHPVEPYYVTMALPKQGKEAEFLIIYPFAPNGKQVMSAWMAARCDYRADSKDGRQYGQITIYQFPKGSQMFGPEQWESEFLANEEFSNWKKVQSADVLRGNLLLFPMEQGMLAVEPIYLRSQAAPIPMLRQVMAGYVLETRGAGRIRSAMGLNLEDALQRLLGEPSEVASSPMGIITRAEERRPMTLSSDFPVLLRQAQQTYDEARAALRDENWAEYGRKIEDLGRILKLLDEKRSNK